MAMQPAPENPLRPLSPLAQHLRYREPSSFEKNFRSFLSRFPPPLLSLSLSLFRSPITSRYLSNESLPLARFRG